jgi:hypothetical protein
MHVVFRESHGLEETETPFDVGQDPADLVVLSFSDSDLGAFTAGYERARRLGADHPTVRLANIIALKHPVSDRGRGLLALWAGGPARPCAPQGHCPCRPARRRAAR